MSATVHRTVTARDFTGNAICEIASGAGPNGCDVLPGVRAEINDDGTMDVIWVEALEFHVAFDEEGMSVLTEEDEGYLTEEAVEALLSFVREQVGADVDVEHADYEQWDSEASYALSARIALPQGLDTPVETVTSIAYDKFVRIMLNITDPGTFGVEYIFRAVAAKMSV